MDLETFWFCVVVVVWADVLPARGVRLRGGNAAPVRPARRTRRGALPCGRSDRSGTGTRSGSSLQAVPHSPRSRPGTRRCSRASTSRSLLILFFLIIRVVSFEWRSKSESPGWRSTWTWANTIGSFGASLLWGIGLSCLVYGVPIDSDGDFTGNLLDLFSAYSVFAGIAVVALFAFHGATFLTLRTTGELRDRAEAAAPEACDSGRRAGRGVPRVDRRGRDGPQRQGSLPAGATRSGRDRGARASTLFLFAGRNGRAFAMTALATIGLVATLFTSCIHA